MSRLTSLALLFALGATAFAPATSFATYLAPDTDPRAFVLNTTDLGTGFRMNSDQSGPRPNEAATSRDDVMRYQQWGRLAGYSAQFERESSLLTQLVGSGLIVQAVSLYRTPDGAQAAFDYSRQRNGQSMELLGTPQVGDASLAFRSRQQSTNGAPAADGIVIQFRKGNLVQTVVVAGPMGAPLMDEAMNLAQVAASRVPD